MKCHSERKTLPNQTVIKEKLHFIRIRSTHLELTSTKQIKRLRIHAHTHTQTIGKLEHYEKVI